MFAAQAAVSARRVGVARATKVAAGRRNLHKNAHVEEWNGLREKTEKTFGKIGCCCGGVQM